MGRYAELHRRSLEEKEAFWAEAAEAVHWIEKWDRVLDASEPPFYRWFVGGQLNTCYNALDRHVKAGHGDRLALIYDSPLTDSQRHFSYAELTERVAGFAGALARLGVGKGDRVLIYMPMVPEAVVAMLACARLGAVHSVVFGGFAANELATRIDDAKPKVMVAASCGLEPGRARRLQAAPRRRHRHGGPQARTLHHPAASAARLRNVGPRYRMAGGARRCGAAPLRRHGGHRSALHPLHQRHDRSAQGHRARLRRPRRGADLDHARPLRRQARRGLLGGERRRLGGRAQLHRLCAALRRLHDGALRGQAGRHARRRGFLAGHRRAWRGVALHRADRFSRDPPAGPGRAS